LSSKIDEMLEFLALDGDWHSIKEASDALNFPCSICENIASFLAKYDFIQFRELKMRINPKMKDFVIASSDESSILRITASIAAAPSIEKM